MSMSKDVTADLARESKRDAKGVDWDRYQAVCDELEGAQSDIEELEAKVSDLELRSTFFEAHVPDEEWKSTLDSFNAHKKANKL